MEHTIHAFGERFQIKSRDDGLSKGEALVLTR